MSCHVSALHSMHDYLPHFYSAMIELYSHVDENADFEGPYMIASFPGSTPQLFFLHCTASDKSWGRGLGTRLLT